MDLSNYSVEDFVCEESFQRFCLGADLSAIDFWQQWIAENPDRHSEVTEAKRIIGILTARQGNLQSSMSQLKDSLQRFDFLKEALVKDSRPSSSSAKRLHARFYISIAASVLFIFAAGWYVITHLKKDRDDSSQIARLKVIRSGTIPRKTLVLPDGSVVTLRKNSELILEQGFNTENRSLTLSGEAFFDVSARTLPFVVHTKDMDIEVLGTVFNVSAYPEKVTEAALFRGKVAISVNTDPGSRIMLSPNQKFVFDGRNIQKKTDQDSSFEVLPLAVDPVDHKAKEIAWVRSRLKIENESLDTICKKLEQWYGIPISFADNEVKAYRYSGTFENETVVKALEALQLSYPFNFRVENNSILISK